MPKGLIIKGVGGRYTVGDGENIFECTARGIFRKNKINPLPGDVVEYNKSDENTEAVIDLIYERRNCLIRPAVANVDNLVIFMSATKPEADLLLLDKLIISAFKDDLNVILCINKCDSEMETNLALRKFKAYSDIGIGLMCLSAKNDINIDLLSSRLDDSVSVFAGQSGAGKSTTINALMNGSIMETGELSLKNNRGKHTTRHTELFRLPSDGYIVDTPGFSSYDLIQLDIQELVSLYPEFSRYTNKCRFKECIHINEPDCAVKNALEEGTIDQGRYDRYKIFADIVKQREINKYKG